MQILTRSQFMVQWARDHNKSLLGDDHGALNYPHGISKAEHRRITKRLDAQASNTHEAETAWQEALRTGTVREPTTVESYMLTATSEFDSERRQAARNCLAKRGYKIDWEQTGHDFIIDFNNGGYEVSAPKPPPEEGTS